MRAHTKPGTRAVYNFQPCICAIQCIYQIRSNGGHAAATLKFVLNHVVTSITLQDVYCHAKPKVNKTGVAQNRAPLKIGRRRKFDAAKNRTPPKIERRPKSDAAKNRTLSKIGRRQKSNAVQNRTPPKIERCPNSDAAKNLTLSKVRRCLKLGI